MPYTRVTQVTVGNTATLLVASARDRIALTIENADSNAMDIGVEKGVTYGKGLRLAQYGTATFYETLGDDSTCAYYGINNAGSGDARIVETIDADSS